MKTRVPVCLVAALLGSAVNAWSQQLELSISNSVAQWSDISDVVVLPSAQRVALEAVALQFGSEIIAAGVEPVDAAQFARSISEGAYIATTPSGLIGKWETGEAELSLSSPAQTDAVMKALSGDVVAMQLRKLPRITVTVSPVPPRDYVILINNQRNRARDRDAEVFAVE
ncbi:MAG: hypothetical protein ACK4S3_09980, partial [Parvibaculum sp.]